MFEYVIRRLLLMIPTFFGTTLLVFYILQSVPDGPFEQAVKQIKMIQMQSGEGNTSTGSNNNSMEISKEVLEKLRRQFGLDKPIWKRYLIWLGWSEKEIEYKEAEIGVPFRYTMNNLGEGKYVPVSLQKWILVNEEGNGDLLIYESPSGTDFEWNTNEYTVLLEYWDIKEEDWIISDWEIKKIMKNDNVGIILSKKQGMFTGYLGHSEKHNEDVGTLIWNRLHISALFGITV